MEEFIVEAVKQVTKNGYSINDTAERLVSIQIHSEIG
jgi:hypothetical protein